MKALILNSGMGSRMGVLTSEHPKCMTEVSAKDTILSRQLKQLAEAGITDAVYSDRIAALLGQAGAALEENRQAEAE